MIFQLHSCEAFDDDCFHAVDSILGTGCRGLLAADRLYDDHLCRRNSEHSGRLLEAAKIDGANSWQLLRYVTIPMLRSTITVCTFLTLTNGFKLFDQNLALTGGNPGKLSELLALNIFNTMYSTQGWQGVGQAKAVIFFILVAIISLIQNKMSRSKEVEQ